MLEPCSMRSYCTPRILLGPGTAPRACTSVRIPKFPDDPKTYLPFVSSATLCALFVSEVFQVPALSKAILDHRLPAPQPKKQNCLARRSVDGQGRNLSSAQLRADARTAHGA